MVEDDMLGEADETSSEGALGSVVALALEWSEDGRLERSTFAQIVEDLALPARLYRPAVDALSNEGIHLVDTESDDDDEEEEEEEDDGPSSRGRGVDPLTRLLRHDVLTQDEEIELAQRIEVGRLAEAFLAEHPELDEQTARIYRRKVADGRRAADDLVAANQRLVMSIAQKYRRSCNASVDIDDLFDEGFFGLARAVEKFDWRRGSKFSTYATWWIRQSITRAIANQSRAIRLPVHAHDDLQRVLRARDDLRREGQEPTVAAIARTSGLSESSVRNLLFVGRSLLALDQAIGDGAATLGDSIADAEDSGPEAIVVLEELRSLIDTAFAELSDRERDVMERRFGLGDRNPQTLEEIGQDYDVTRERIRQIQKIATSKLSNQKDRARFEAYIS